MKKAKVERQKSKSKNRSADDFFGVSVLYLAFCVVLFSFFSARAQTGGTFTIRQSVVAAGGGQNSAGGNFAVAGTIGQPLVQTSAAGRYTVNSGFWAEYSYAPTAAGASISGRVTTFDGRGLMNAFVILTASTGETKIVRTGSFGYYKFGDVAAGQTYLLGVSSKRFLFAPQIVSLVNDLTEINFVASAR